jgi:hypothetical protein
MYGFEANLLEIQCLYTNMAIYMGHTLLEPTVSQHQIPLPLPLTSPTSILFKIMIHQHTSHTHSVPSFVLLLNHA